MSEYIGYLALASKEGHLVEGTDHAAKIYWHLDDAIRASRVLNGQQVERLRYSAAIQGLLGGSAFCFDTSEGFERFLKTLRNDPIHKPYLAKTGSRRYIRWVEAPKPNVANLVSQLAAAPTPKSLT